MLIGIDIGNTSIGWGLFLKPERGGLKYFKKMSTYPIRTVKEYAEVFEELIKDAEIKDGKSEAKNVIISSVVPIITPLVMEALKIAKVKKIVTVNHKNTGNLTLRVHNKRGIGSDRIANAVGAYHYFQQALAVIDCGTATTITVVGEKAEIIGGAILPGVGLMQSSLFNSTAKLPAVKPKVTKRALGRDTISAISSGIIYGTAGALEKIISRIEKELNYSLKILLTGGYAKLISSVLDLKHIVIPYLIFEGLRLIYLKAMEK
ncbi:MAG: type III pantothenate kinase [Thermodesulfovibrionales bacterium]|nr:type III pantothenate kinase [Thermodesulfovibrionales bacterium]